MPGPILSLYVLVSMTFVMINVMITTNDYRGYAQGVILCDYLIIYHDTLVAKTWSIVW